MSDSELRRVFANNLRFYLNKHGYSQADMARYMKVSTATTAKWCTGQTIPIHGKVRETQQISGFTGFFRTYRKPPKTSKTAGFRCGIRVSCGIFVA